MSTKYLHGRTEAHEIETRLTVAYYLACAGKTDDANHHYESARSQFEQLAGKLGFRVFRTIPEISPVREPVAQAAE